MVDWKARDGMNYYMHFLHAHVADQIRLFECADLFDLSGSGLEQHNQVLKKLLHHYSNQLDRQATVAKRQKAGGNYAHDDVIPDRIYQVMTRLRCQRQCQAARTELSRSIEQVERGRQRSVVAAVERVAATKCERQVEHFDRKRCKQASAKETSAATTSPVAEPMSKSPTS